MLRVPRPVISQESNVVLILDLTYYNSYASDCAVYKVFLEILFDLLIVEGVQVEVTLNVTKTYFSSY